MREVFKRWDRIWRNKDNELETRLKAYSILRVIEAAVVIYERQEVLDEDTIDDLFIAWGKGIKPVFPEDMPKILESIKKQKKSME
jgi:hypothetical protein